MIFQIKSNVSKWLYFACPYQGVNYSFEGRTGPLVTPRFKADKLENLKDEW